MERILCLAMGYAFGLIQTGYFYGKLHSVDLHKYGSGNVGTTNALRVLGWKAGLIVFLGDFLKTVIPCMLVRFVLFQDRPEMTYVLMLYTAFGVILGHNYPFYMGFKGGKGIAATAGLIFSMDWRVLRCRCGHRPFGHLAAPGKYRPAAPRHGEQAGREEKIEN